MKEDAFVHFGNWLRWKVGQRGGPTRFSKEAGGSKDTLQQLFRRETDAKIRDGVWFFLSEGLKMSREEIGNAWRREPLPPHQRLLPPSGVSTHAHVFGNGVVPTYDAKVAACRWIPLTKVYEANTKTQAAIVDDGRFRVRIAGDCMEPRWHDGDVVEFRIVRLDKEAWPVGEDCIFIHSDDLVTFKRLNSIDDDTVTLYALNEEKYPDPISVPVQMVTRVAVALNRIEEPRPDTFKPKGKTALKS